MARKPASAEAVGLSADGAATQAESVNWFVELLTTQAKVNARRRGALAADKADVESACRELLGSRERPFWFDVGTEAGLVVSGLLAGYAYSLFSQAVPANVTGGVVLATAVALGVFCVYLKRARL